MELVENKEQIIDNCKYLIKNIDNEDVKNIIFNGRCFLKCFYEDKIYFFPSKFIGYKDNNIDKYNAAKYDKNIAHLLNDNHEKNKFHANYTNYIIKRIMNEDFKVDSIINEEYKKFCSDIGIKTTKYIKQYIVLDEKIK